MTAIAASTSTSLRIGVTAVPGEGAAVLTVTVSGEVDSASAPGLAGCLAEVLGRPGVGRVVVDLAGISFLDCAGLTALAAADLDARRRGRSLLVRTGGNRAARRPLEMTGLVDVLAHAPE